VPADSRGGSSAGALLLSAGLIVVAGIVVYLNSFSGVMLFDDERHIVTNELIRSLSPLSEHLVGWRRPAISLSLAVNYAIGGLDVWGYHAFNLAVHLLAALTFFGLVRGTLRLRQFAPRWSGAATGVALATALLWVVHPLNTQSVTYIIQRCESLMGLFYLLTLYCVLRGAGSPSGRRWYAAAVLSCALGMTAKAVMVTAPLAVLLYDRCVLTAGPSTGGSFRAALRRRWGLYLGLAASWAVLGLCGVVSGVLHPAPGHAVAVGFGVQDITPWQYLGTQAGVILHYLRLSFWPHPLCLDYHWPIAATPAEVAVPGVVVALLLGLTGWALVRRPAAGFVAAGFFLILAPTSSVVPIVDAAFEHRMYLPLASVILLTVVGVRMLTARVATGTTASGRGGRAVLAGITCVAALLLGWRTVARNADYRSAEAMWRDVVARRPENPRGWTNLARALTGQGGLEEAAALYEQANELDPDRFLARYGLGIVYRRQGRYEAAARQFRQARRVDPRSEKAADALANVLRRLDRLDEAARCHAEAVQLNPEYAEGHVNYGITLRRLGRPEDAATHYRKALQIDPHHPQAHHNLAFLLQQQGDPEAALRHYAAVARLDPDDAPPAVQASALYHAGTILESRNRLNAAIERYRAALRIAPDHRWAQARLAQILETRQTEQR